MSDATCISHSVITTTLPHQPLDVSSDVGIKSDSITSQPQQRVGDSSDDVTSEARTLEVDPPQPVACPLELPSVAPTDVGTHVDVRTDCQHIHADEAVLGLDETVYHDCISTSFTSKLLFFSSDF